VLILLFLGATFLISLTPGPVVLLTIAVSVRAGVGPALRAIAGICTGSASYLLVALAGVIGVLLAHRTVFHAVQIAGATYLVYLGARMVASAVRFAATAALVAPVHERPYLDGLVTQLSNPKALLYWTALLPPFLDPARPVAAQLLVLVSIGIAVDIAVLSAYALAAASARSWLQDPRFRQTVNLLAGGLFAATGVLLAITNVRALAGAT
jgi:threonine/homoserine/homoserine lactone efflux protein